MSTWDYSGYSHPQMLLRHEEAPLLAATSYGNHRIQTRRQGTHTVGLGQISECAFPRSCLARIPHHLELRLVGVVVL